MASSPKLNREETKIAELLPEGFTVRLTREAIGGEPAISACEYWKDFSENFVIERNGEVVFAAGIDEAYSAILGVRMFLQAMAKQGKAIA